MYHGPACAKHGEMTRLRGAENLVVRPADVADGCVVTVFRVPPEVAGQRVDVFLQSQMKRTSRTRAQEILILSAYDGAGRRLRKGSRVFPEQQIVLWRAPWDETPVATDIGILYEDEHLVAVNKPANLPVHPTARYHKNTLINLLKASRPGEWLSLGHRIDRETSGVLLVSKTPLCDRTLKRQLEQRDDIEKTYVALTWGAPLLAGADDPRKFRYEKSLELDLASKYKVKMRIGQTPTALYAATRFTVEETRYATPERAYSRVRCELETGRQHQIRVHLASLGAPIVGDKLYGPDEAMFARSADGELTPADSALLELPRHALHAAQLALAHPMTGERLVIDAPLPRDMAGFWDALPLSLSRSL